MICFFIVWCLILQKTLLADKGEIRVGSRYQCDVTSLLRESESDGRDLSSLETLVWTPEHNLNDKEIDQFLVVARSVGTFARALDCSSSVKQPSLHMSAAAASRDITLLHAMDTLHEHNYTLASALCSFVPSSGPLLCRDEMEEWSASEANLFEEALEKILLYVENDRSICSTKRIKAVDAESKLKQVYIPCYSKSNPALLNNHKGVVNGNSNGTTEIIIPLGGKACESCNVTVSTQWYAWGPTHMQSRVCQCCWSYWKRYGGLKVPTRYGDGDFDFIIKRSTVVMVRRKNFSMLSHRPHRCNISGCGKEFKLKAHLGKHYATAHGLMVRSGSPRPIMKTRTAFYLCTTPVTRLSRRLCLHIMKPRHAARAPFYSINIQAVKQECSVQMVGKTLIELRRLLIYKKKNRGSVTDIATRIGNPGSVVAPWLILTDKDKLPKPEVVAFPKPPKAPDGSLLYERVPNKYDEDMIAFNSLSPSLKRKTYEEMNGIDGSVVTGPPIKRPTKDPSPQHRLPMMSSEQYAAAMAAAMASGQPLPSRHIAQINGKPKMSHMRSGSSGRKHVLSWMDAPDDVYFRVTDTNRSIRRRVTSLELRRAARKPWRFVKFKDSVPLVVLD